MNINKNCTMIRNCGIKMVFAVVSILTVSSVNAQRYLSDYDSTLFIRDTLRPFLKRYVNLHFSAYMQPQYQVAQQKGIDSYEGGNFADNTNNRFMIRRARVKMDYMLPSKEKDFPSALFTFQ